MKYLAKKFSSRPSNKAYRDNFDETFRSGLSEEAKKKLHKWFEIRDRKSKPSKGTK